jgi:ABC-type dipeptide transport system, periplasmic component
MYAKEDFLKSVAVLVAFLVTLSILGALGVTNQVSAQGAYLPPYSIYGTPTPPSNVAVLNSTGEYWGPYIGSIYFTWFTTSEAIIEALVNNYIQYDAGGVGSIQQYNQLEAYVKAGEVAINETPANSFGYLGFNVHVYPFSNVHFRRAIQHLTNYQAIASVLYNGILGIASPYYYLPQVYGQYFSPQEQQAYQKYGAYNTTAAIQELELAGLVDHPAQGYWTFSNGTRVPTFTIYTSSGTNVQLREQVLSVITNAAASINLSIQIVPVNFNTFVDTLLPTGNYEMYNIGWILGAPVNPSWVYYIFGPYPLNTNYQDYTNETVWDLSTKLLTQAATYQEATQLAQQIGTILQEDLPYVILDWGVNLIPVRVDTWKGYISEPPYGQLFPADIHPVNTTFGTLYRFGQPQAPDTLNLYIATTLYDFQILGNEYTTPLQVSLNNPVQLFPYAAYNYTVSAGAGVTPNGHPYNGTVVTMNFLPNQVWWDGVPVTALRLQL